MLLYLLQKISIYQFYLFVFFRIFYLLPAHQTILSRKKKAKKCFQLWMIRNVWAPNQHCVTLKPGVMPSRINSVLKNIKIENGLFFLFFFFDRINEALFSNAKKCSLLLIAASFITIFCEYFVNDLYWYLMSSTQVDYRLGFQVENTSAMDQPQSNISAQGEVPRTRSGEPNVFSFLFFAVISCWVWSVKRCCC